MADRFAANLPDIRSSAGDFGNVASELARIRSTVNNEVPDPRLIAASDDGTNDDFTDLFGNKIDPAVRGAEQLLLGLHDGVGTQQDKLLTTVDFYDKANNHNTEQAGNLLNHAVNP